LPFFAIPSGIDRILCIRRRLASALRAWAQVKTMRRWPGFFRTRLPQFLSMNWA
jgi:hypothetical protein